MYRNSKCVARRIRAWILGMLIALCSAGNAAASEIRDMIFFLGNDKPVQIDIRAEFDKIAQFDERRTEQLNLVMKHIAFRGILSRYETELTAVLGDQDLFSITGTEGGNVLKSAFLPEPDCRYLIPDLTDNQSESPYIQVFESISENRDIFCSLEDFVSFVGKLPECFPEQTGTAKILQKYKDYGTAVLKKTVRISAEELTDCIRAHPADFRTEHCIPDPEMLVFSGRQDFELLTDEEGKPIKIRYGGSAGYGADDMRTVRLEWKTVRSDSVDRDELSIRTPNSDGTRRNNFILNHERRYTEEGRETFLWKAERDDLSDGVRIRRLLQADAAAEGKNISGSVSETVIIKDKTTENQIAFDMEGKPEDHCAGTLEIISKKDKIEKDGLKIKFSLSPESGLSAEDVLPEIREIKGNEFNAVREALFSGILGELMKLPAEDLVFLTEGIPEELMKEVLPNSESAKEPAK